MSALHDTEREELSHLKRGKSSDSENEKEKFGLSKIEDGRTGYPESEPKEDEQMEAGDMRDLQLQHVCNLYSTCLDSS